MFGQCGRMAFYHFLAIFPALLMFHVAANHIPGLGANVQRSLAQAASKLLPVDLVETVRFATGGFDRVHLAAWRFLATLAGVLWACCNGTWAMIYALNTAYEVQECRPARQLASTIVGLTAALVLITTLALGIVSLGSSLRSRLHAPVPLGFVESIVLIAVLLFWFSVLYRFAPSLEKRRWKWSTPGALVAAALWIGATLGARFYFEHVDDYHVSFGQLNGVAMLLLWLYVANGAILIGGEMNSEIEKATNKKD